MREPEKMLTQVYIHTMWAKGLGTAGVWLGTGMVGLADQKGWSALLGIFAFLATAVIWISPKDIK